MADNCGKCLSLDEKFGCGWCQSSGKCEVKDKCGNDASSWLNRDQTCPNPQVTSFEPMLGPWEGNSIFFLKRPHNWKQSRVPMLKSPQSRIIKNVITAPHIALALFAFRI